MQIYRRLSQLHEDERLIAFGATRAGRALIWLAATLLLLPERRVALLVSPLIALLMWLPQHRRPILGAGALAAYFEILTRWGVRDTDTLVVWLALSIAASYLYFRLALGFRDLPSLVRRFPLAVAHAPTLALLAFLGWRRGAGGPVELDPWMALALVLLPFLMWRWSYLLFSGRRGRVEGTGFADHLFYILPPFGGTEVPYGKGYDTLSRRSAASARDTSRSQLAGLKLLVLAIVWERLNHAIRAAVYGAPSRSFDRVFGDADLGLIPLGRLLASDAPLDLTIAVAWGTLFSEFIVHVVGLAAFGHVIVGCLRLLGYNVFRNTYKPLLAESLVEYWNRLYYYFKELLVEFFFYPTFVACAGLPKNLRTFLAIMAAAFLGNFYYHVVRDSPRILQSSAAEIVAGLVPWLFYAFVLGLGIFVSMMRERKRRSSKESERAPLAAALVRTRRILGVWAFYGFLTIWIAGPSSVGFGERLEFLFALFGVR